MSTVTRIFVVVCALLMMSGTTSAGKIVKVVATFSILGDMVKNIGGDRVDVTTLVGPDGDVHTYEPTPAAAKIVSEADLVVVKGLGLEGWLDRQIRKEKITAVFIEKVSDPRMIKQISKEGGVTVGGELFSDALSKPDGPAATYVEMFKNNVTKIVAAMKKK